MPAATASDLQLWLGRPAGFDLERAGFLLECARDLVVAESGLGATAWPPALRTVQLTAAVRAYTNPAGKGQDSVGARSYTVREVGIYLTDSERRQCRVASGRSGDLTSVRLTTPAEVDFPVSPQ